MAKGVAALAALAGVMLGAAAPMPVEEAAKLFGSRPLIEDISLSPDGKRVAIVGPSGPRSSALAIGGEDGQLKPIANVAGTELRLTGCGWSASDRLVCTQYGVSGTNYAMNLGYVRLFAIGADGGNVKPLGRPSRDALRISTYGGGVLDWMTGSDGTVLMERDFVPEYSTGTHLASSQDGLGVERVDTRTLHAVRVEQPHKAAGYVSDGQGRVRIMAVAATSGGVMMNGRINYFYRPAAGGNWKPLCSDDVDHTGTSPIAVDPNLDMAYALRKLDGRRALYRLALDGSGKAELAYANPRVDVENVIQVGRAARVIGATYVTEERHIAYFDPTYEKLAASLARAIPKLPQIGFVGASADENFLLMRAGSDVDPGRYYVLDRTTHHLETVMGERPLLDGKVLGAMKPVTFPGPDGTPIPGYLTLPPGSDGRGLPAIVMPHGGPGARDEWGFDWLVQFYAARGFAVLQPEFRGSTGYGDDWFQKNGFQSWRVAIGDVAAAGRWLVAQGIADPAKLAIVGWSYGGYAALQAQVLAPGLFKATVAIAPVTDFAMWKEQFRDFQNFEVMTSYVGDGPHIVEGSPLRNVQAFQAPVLMFHGDRDLNVGIEESRAMARALKAAGKDGELVTYAGLDHQLPDSQARIDMLTRSDAFLRRALKL